MSNEVYGYAVLGAKRYSFAEVKEGLERCTELGFHATPKEQLVGFERPYLPGDDDLIFEVGDSARSRNAQSLLDLEDYAPEANTHLPILGEPRLNLLAELVYHLFTDYQVRQVVIAITECSQIEERKAIPLAQFGQILLRDSRETAPPCCLYAISE